MTVKCECGYEAKNGRGLHAHKFHCKGKSPGAAKAKECEVSEDGKHDWKFLDTSHPVLGEQMQLAKEQGYKKYCDDCGEMSK